MQLFFFLSHQLLDSINSYLFYSFPPLTCFICFSFPEINNCNLFYPLKNSAISFTSNSPQSRDFFFFFQNQVMGNNTRWIAEMNYGICTEWRFLLNAFSLLLIAAINWGLRYLGNLQRCPNFVLTLIPLTWMASASKTVLHIPTLFYLLAHCPFTQLTETSPRTFPLFLNLVKQF